MQITINNTGSFENRAHEAKHAYQVLSGEMVPESGGSRAFSHPRGGDFSAFLNSEVAAYRRQYSVSSSPSLPLSEAGIPMKDINAR